MNARTKAKGKALTSSADPLTCAALADGYADLGSMAGDLADVLTTIVAELDGAELPKAKAKRHALTFPANTLLGKLELEQVTLRASLEICEALAAHLQRRL